MDLTIIERHQKDAISFIDEYLGLDNEKDYLGNLIKFDFLSLKILLRINLLI